MARIILVDDHRIFREGLVSLIGASDRDQLVASLDGVATVLSSIKEHDADMVLLDLSMDGKLVFPTITEIKENYPGVRVIVLSMHGEPEIVEQAIKAGANGYTLKRDAFEDLMLAIRAAERGARFISPGLMDPQSGGGKSEAENEENAATSEPLPERQQQILQLVARGLSNKQIAAELNIALPTVKNHLTALFRKFAVTNRVELLNRLNMISAQSS